MRALAPIHAQEDEELTEYELARLAAIKANAELLLSLGLDPAPTTPVRPKKKAKLEGSASPSSIVDQESSESASSEGQAVKQSLGRGVRPGRRRITREEPGWGIFAGVFIGGGDEDKEGSSLFPISPPSTSARGGRSVVRPLAASESPRPSARSSSPVRKLRGRAESAPFVLSVAPGQGQDKAGAEVALRRSARNEERRTSPRTSTAAGDLTSSGSGTSGTRRFSQRSFVVPDSRIETEAATSLIDAEGDFTFHTRVLPRLITPPASTRPKRQRRRTSPGSGSGPVATTLPLLQLGRTLSTRLYSPKQFGPIPGIPPGSWYPTRMACSTSSLHAPTVAGISGDSSRGAYSLCLSGGYEDDEDLGCSVTFTGSGGRDLRGTPAKRKNLRTAPQSAHQNFQNPLNAALKRSVQTQRPVRVLRGFKGRKPYAPPEGYLYSGLYVVERCWTERGQSGWDVCRFALRRLEGQGELPTFRSAEEE
ncbi:hypothetical protein BCV69DRAFT_283472 [Microstroma glucosiphilum]|uniref:YDG domain-containing protein n=1 Tax=Pseudomicrostroma glucosiphilum TaxID=1684307 RepID=A0A316U6H7_9BASI|nr:hypothetical protein BCV69DRAFT_283472 [Pseudomicrostroma glucosiphilum]PWN19943.1 hypothetical protein BCV69DRAFT_283472 [Pseudomicrostroma glucosiphilum]